MAVNKYNIFVYDLGELSAECRRIASGRVVCEKEKSL
jgi:hypothetical protein